MNAVSENRSGLNRGLELSVRFKLLITFSAALFAYWCFLDQYPAVVHPCNCADAYAYTYIGNLYQASGFENHTWGKLRSYAYPLFLSGIFEVAGFFKIDSAHAIFSFQVFVYFACAQIFSKHLSLHTSRSLGDLVFVALLLNIYIYPVLAISLTDGISVCILLLIGTAVVDIAFQGVKARNLAAFGFMCGLSVMVRPSTLFLLAPLLATLIYYCFFSNHRASTKIGLLALCAVCFALPVIPQVYLNVKFFDRWTFLPVFDLGKFQIDYGIKMIKYATNLTDGNPALPYFNPFSTPNTDGVFWYLLNPKNGFITAFLHLFAALDFDYLTVYIFDRNPWYRPALFIYSQSINFWGTAGILYWQKRCYSLKEWETKKNRGDIYLVSMISLFIIGWASVTSISAVENRFALPIVALLLPFAFWSIFSGKFREKLFSAPLWIWYFIYLSFAMVISGYIGGLKVFK